MVASQQKANNRHADSEAWEHWKQKGKCVRIVVLG